MRSFLNLIDLATGHQIRLAELGFKAEYPSFCDGGVSFKRGDDEYMLSLDDGSIRRGNSVDAINAPSLKPDGDASLRFLSDGEEVRYCELTVGGRVVARFMGGEGSLGDVPVQGGKVVFIGYPSEDGIN